MPARPIAAPRRVLVALALLGLGCSRPGRDSPAAIRLIDVLPFALAVPSLPPSGPLLRLARLPDPSWARAMVVVPYPGPQLALFRARLGVDRAGAVHPAEMRSLSAAELRQLAPGAQELSGPPPGAPLGGCVAQGAPSRGAVLCQRLSTLPDTAAGFAIVFPRADLGVRELEAYPGEFQSPRGPRAPRFAGLVRPVWRPPANRRAQSWRTSLVAPANQGYEFEIALPRGGPLRLQFGATLLPNTPFGAARFVVRVDRREVFAGTLPDPMRWSDFEVPIEGRPGTTIRLELVVVSGDPRVVGAWGSPRLMAATRRPHVVLVTLDAARVDHLSAYGYARPTTPTLGQLATQGVRFDRAYAQAPATWQSLPSLFSGLQPVRNGVRVPGAHLPGYLTYLPDLLAAAGYDTFAGADLGIVAPEDMLFFDDAELSHELIPQFDEVANRMRRGPVFAWFHLENPHYPLHPRDPDRFDPGYEGRFRESIGESREDLVHSERLTPSERRHALALYDSTLVDADELLRELLLRIDATGQSRNTVVVVTADHGTLLDEHGFVIWHSLPYERVLHVPLVVGWLGHLHPRVVAQQVQLVDLLPTLAALAGAHPAPGSFDGRDLAPLLAGGALPDEPVFGETAGNIVREQDQNQVVLLGSDAEHPVRASALDREQFFGPINLYDLATDPDELHDLSAEQPQRARAAARALRDRMNAWAARRLGAGDQVLGQAAVEALQQAGYAPPAKPGASAR